MLYASTSRRARPDLAPEPGQRGDADEPRARSASTSAPMSGSTSRAPTTSATSPGHGTGPLGRRALSRRRHDGRHPPARPDRAWRRDDHRSCRLAGLTTPTGRATARPVEPIAQLRAKPARDMAAITSTTSRPTGEEQRRRSCCAGWPRATAAARWRPSTTPTAVGSSGSGCCSCATAASAEDLVQETFVRLWRSVRTLRPVALVGADVRLHARPSRRRRPLAEAEGAAARRLCGRSSRRTSPADEAFQHLRPPPRRPRGARRALPGPPRGARAPVRPRPHPGRRSAGSPRHPSRHRQVAHAPWRCARWHASSEERGPP